MKIAKHRVGPAEQRRAISGRMPNGGFTIVEVMIFLAVSGLMFVLAAVFINGKQDTVSYRQGMQASASSVTNVINSVSNGQYPDAGSFTCNASGGSVGPPTISTHVSSEQGTNNGCMFLGEVLQFLQPGSAGYKEYIVAGRQFASDDVSTPVQSFADASPIVVDPLTQTGTLEHGLEYSQAVLCASTPTPNTCNSPEQIGGVGFFGSFGGAGGDADDQSSGAQTVSVVAIRSGHIMSEISDLSRYGDGAVLKPTQYIVLCFERGDKNGSVTIGGPGGQSTSVSVQFDSDAVCH